MNEISDIIDPDKETLSIVKFSPNSDLLVVCYTPPYNVIALYSTKNWREVKRIQDTKSRINCLDFSING